MYSLLHTRYTFELHGICVEYQTVTSIKPRLSLKKFCINHSLLFSKSVLIVFRICDGNWE